MLNEYLLEIVIAGFILLQGMNLWIILFYKQEVTRLLAPKKPKPYRPPPIDYECHGCFMLLGMADGHYRGKYFYCLQCTVELDDLAMGE